MVEMDGTGGQAVASPRADSAVTFEQFYEAKYVDLMRAVMSVGACEQDAHDAIEEVMEEILTKDLWPTLHHPYSWVRRAVLRTYVDKQMRDRDGIRRAIQGGYLMDEDECGLDTALNIWEDDQWITLMLSMLAPAQREVIEYVLAEYKPTEIAELLGKTPATVRQNLALARRKLKTQLNDDYEVPGASLRETTREGGRR